MPPKTTLDNLWGYITRLDAALKEEKNKNKALQKEVEKLKKQLGKERARRRSGRSRE